MSLGDIKIDNPLFEHQKMPKNTYKSYSSKCKVEIFHYNVQNPEKDYFLEGLMQVKHTVYDHNSESNPVIAFNYTKANNIASGYFTLTFLPTENWFSEIAPGDWILIYLTNGQTDKYHLRCFGNVDSVNFSDDISAETGARTVRYTVSGQDFGKVLDKYFIFINPWIGTADFNEVVLKNILALLDVSPDEAIKTLLQVFLSKQIDAFGGFEGQQGLKQWFLPSELAQKFGGYGGTDNRFFDILNLKNIQKGLDGRCLIKNLDIQGSLWSMLKEYSNFPINELFVELDEDEKPSIYLRMIPFTFKNYSDALLSNIGYFLDLDVVQIGGQDILASSVGVNEHDRRTMFFLASEFLDKDPASSAISATVVAPEFPWINAAECKRYGLSIYKLSTPYLTITSGGQINNQLLTSWNKIIKHWFQDNPYLQSGTIVISGRKDVRLGKRLDVVSGPMINYDDTGSVKRSFYIEGYSDNWTFGNLWTQHLTLTRGVYIKDGAEKFYYDMAGYQGSIGLTTVKKAP